ncbi:MAG: energy-coupling factor ABC transporter permease [Chloroflexi bacterium]|nr:energy-coupling factor ABC transporter permease [Chloroflexota bacterium]MDA1240550.1 energy-coupling factor ABC transporter permease [Chloroflexota bacterium]MQC48018.1 cobalamin biosynthesis protein CbiM [Chloroflexota bacterium]
MLPPGLHIPDGFLSTPISLAAWVIAIVVLALAVRFADRDLDERAVPLMGVMAAFIFAAQMMNFPVAGGTSGHMVGGALAAILLGPWAAIIVLTAVVALQALLFQDGGLVVMGANILNMGIITVLLATLIYRVCRPFALGNAAALGIAFVAAWITVEASAIATALQLAASGTSPLEVVFPAMVSVHALIGIGEGLITAAALGFVLATRPDLVPRPAAATR